MKKKGFTLIELLTVILILGIITLIAIPVINKVVEKAKTGSIRVSTLEYIEAIEQAAAYNALKQENVFLDQLYTVEEVNSKNVSIKGTTPDDGWVVMKNERVKDCSFKVGKYVVNCGGELNIVLSDQVRKIPYLEYTDSFVSQIMSASLSNGVYNVALLAEHSLVNENITSGWIYRKNGLIKGYSFIADGRVVNYDESTSSSVLSETNTLLEEPDIIVCKSVTTNVYSRGEKYICDPGDGVERIFYVLQNDTTSVQLIMNKNISGKTAWGTSNNDYTGNKINGELLNLTKNWVDVTTKLPISNQIFLANNGNQTYDSSTQRYNLITNKTTYPSWLEQNVDCTNTAAKCNDGVTSATAAGYWMANRRTVTSYCAPYIFSIANTYYGVLGDNTAPSAYYGIRPVIVVDKEMIK